MKTSYLFLFLTVQFYWMLGPLLFASGWFVVTNPQSFAVLQLF